MDSEEDNSNSRDKKEENKTFIGSDGLHYPNRRVTPDRRVSDGDTGQRTFIGLDGRKQTDRRTLKDRRRPWASNKYKGPERRYHIRRKTKYIRAEDKIEERHYDRRRDDRNE